MKKLFLFAVCLLALASTNAFADDGDLLAFPGAQGFGRYATGGRGGSVYHVTSLEDTNTQGTFRNAVSGTNRIIVFDVSGVIKLTSALVVSGNNTILGQTAPGEGIQVYGDRVSFSGASNLIVRYVRFRMGVNGTSEQDACGIANGTNMIFDHVTALWGRDECFSINPDNKADLGSITIQNSIIGQGLQDHSCGGLIQTDGGVTLYRNLYIENKTRNPKVKGLNQFVNNVVYNWGNGGCYIMGGSEGDSWADIESNYFMNGPWNSATAVFTRGTPTFRYYGPNNYYDSDKDGTVNGTLMTQEETCGREKQNDGSYLWSTWMDSREALNEDITAYNESNGTSIQTIPEITNIMTAEEALYWILDSVGPVLPVRDEVDQYLIDELASFGTEGTKNGIATEKTLSHGGTGVLSGGVKPTDSDNDGIPDEWEIANGLDPNNASDATEIAANGYMNIENYSFSIVTHYPYIKKPINLDAISNKNSLDLSWELNKNTDNGFIIEISTDGSEYSEVGRVEAGVTEYEVTDLEADTKYYVRVCAYNDDESLYSDYAELETATIDDPTAPKLSENPYPEDESSLGIAAGVEFTWENTTLKFGGALTYDLYLGTDANNLEQVASGLTDKKYYVEELNANTTYYWRVDATNELGTTEGTVWSFFAEAGGNLFTANFYTLPEEWYEKYGSITSNTDVFNGANQLVTIGGMQIGSGENTVRVVAMAEANNAESTSDSYGPATEDDAGASDRCIQFYTTASGGYLITPEVIGPCSLTLYLGNPETSSKTVKLSTVIDGTTTQVADLTLGAKKRVYKFVYDYNDDNDVAFRIDNNAVKFNINDIIIDSTQSSGIYNATANNNDNATFCVDGNTVIVSNVKAGSRIVVCDMSGRVVTSTTAAPGSTSITLTPGFYIIAAQGGAIKVIL
ncbi:MAG: fibronectin type III domain-containing protein [Prevotella sp.]|nr:fibronectin type III domain-containing protein [Prevotella sp.]